MWLMFTLATTLLWGLAELFYKKGSHEEEKFDHLMQRFDRECTITKIPAPGLVRLIEAGKSDTPETDALLQKLLGHASIKTTMDRYVHVTDDSLTKAVQQFERLFA